MVNGFKVIIVRKMLARKSVIRYLLKDNHIFESQMQLEVSFETNALIRILKFIVIC
jgi:hypothetical protein